MQISPYLRIHNSTAMRLLAVIAVASLVYAAVAASTNRPCGWNDNSVPSYRCAP